jgi:hypothetical protein
MELARIKTTAAEYTQRKRTLFYIGFLPMMFDDAKTMTESIVKAI